MFTETEIHILKETAKLVKIERDYLQIDSTRLAFKSEGIEFSFDDLFSPSFPVKKEIFDAWKQANRATVSFEPIKEELGLKLIQFPSFENLDEKWSVLYTFSRPGFLVGLNQALIQVTAYCMSGPPNYGSIYLLEKKGISWETRGNFGLYNQ